MKNRIVIVSALAIALSLQTAHISVSDAKKNFTLTATNPTPLKNNVQSEDQEQIYAVQLMTQQERDAFRANMAAAKTAAEREQVRNKNNKAMQERAESHGLTLPDQIPAGKQGMSQGKEMIDRSEGMGQGDGMGSGNGQSE